LEQAAMIAVKGLTRRFDSRVAVEDLTLDVCPGEIFGLLGPNGAGKTTTLRMLAGLIGPTSGTATVAGVPLVRERMDEVRSKVGFLTEAPGLWDRLTVKLNLLVYARLYGVRDPERAVAQGLAMFGLEDRAGTLAAQLSKGMKQKVAIVRALLHSPPVILLDEPTSGLDPQTARLVRELVLELRDRGHTIVISTHNLDEAERVSSRIGVLQRRLIAVDTPDALRRRLFGHRVRVRLAAAAPGHGEAALRAGGRDLQLLDDGFTLDMENVDRDTPAIVRAIVAAGAEVLAVIPEQAPLEDVYLALINESKQEGSAS
jgi:ABC-2 type transport system ATP-binding protein